MSEEVKYINILDKKSVGIPKEEWEGVRDNPEGLTVEGIKFNIIEWKVRSRNKYLVAKYRKMLNECKNFSTSGKLDNGKTILSRSKDGKVTWSESIDYDLDAMVKSLKV